MQSHARLSSYVKSTDTLWSVDLVPTNRQQINVVLVYIDWHFARSLCCICMEEDLPLPTDLPNLLYRLDNADLVVYVNNRAQQGVLAYSALQLVQVDDAVCLYRKVSDFVTLILQLAARVKNALMLYLCSDDVSLFIAIERGHSLQTQIIRLSSTTSEYNLLACGSNKLSNLLSGIFTCFLSFPSKTV